MRMESRKSRRVLQINQCVCVVTSGLTYEFKGLNLGFASTTLKDGALFTGYVILSATHSLFVASEIEQPFNHGHGRGAP